MRVGLGMKQLQTKVLTAGQFHKLTCGFYWLSFAPQKYDGATIALLDGFGDPIILENQPWTSPENMSFLSPSAGTDITVTCVAGVLNLTYV